MRHLRRMGYGLAATLAAACGVTGPGTGRVRVSISGDRGQSVVAYPGNEIDVTLQTIGMGDFASPPTIWSSAVRFLGDSLVGPFIPAGPTHQFRFEAVVAGTAVVHFVNPMQNRIVEDTIVVR